MNEKTFGKEQIKVKVDHLATSIPLSFFGDPVTGTTSYALCLYDHTNALAGALRIVRAQATCGTRPCWKLTGTTGYKYADKLLTSDGVLQIVLKSGLATKGKALVKAKNDLGHGLRNMPTGIVSNLMANATATAQILSSNGGCVTGTAVTVREADNIIFKASAP